MRTPIAGKDSFLLRKTQWDAFVVLPTHFQFDIPELFSHFSQQRKTYNDRCIILEMSFYTQPTETLPQSPPALKPCKHHYYYRPCWQILNQRCYSRASK